MLALNEKEHRILREPSKQCRCKPGDHEVMGLVEKGFVELVIRVTMAGFREIGHHVPKRDSNDNDGGSVA